MDKKKEFWGDRALGVKSHLPHLPRITRAMRERCANQLFYALKHRSPITCKNNAINAHLRLELNRLVLRSVSVSSGVGPRTDSLLVLEFQGYKEARCETLPRTGFLL